MDKETEAERNRGYVYFKVSAKNVTHTAKFLFKIYKLVYI